MRSVRAIVLMVASWMSFVSARPANAAVGERELLATAAVDVSVAAPAARYAVVSDAGATTRLSRVTPLALFLCAVACLSLGAENVARARTEAAARPRVVDPRVAPYDAMAPPVL